MAVFMFYIGVFSILLTVAGIIGDLIEKFFIW